MFKSFFVILLVLVSFKGKNIMKHIKLFYFVSSNLLYLTYVLDSSADPKSIISITRIVIIIIICMFSADGVGDDAVVYVQYECTVRMYSTNVQY